MSARSLIIVTRPDDALGFRLAGVQVEAVTEGAEAEHLRPLLEDPAVGLLAIEEGVLRRVPEPLLERARRAGLPVLFPFALPRHWQDTGSARSYVSALIQRAIGYHVRLA